MEIKAIIENGRGGWSIVVDGGQTVGNYATREDAARIASLNGWTQKKSANGSRR